MKTEMKKMISDGRSIPLMIMRPKGQKEGAPGVLWIHGGGYATGMACMPRFLGRAGSLVKKFGAVVVSPGYTLSVKAPYPAAAEDCHAALVWMTGHAAELGIDPGRIVVGGESAGGGLAAAVCMMARDRRSARIMYQIPLYPMLDCFDTPSSRDNHAHVWNTKRNHDAWRLYLKGVDMKNVPPYASPARQTDYSGLPPCYTFVCEGESFRDETLAYVENLKKAGAEAHADVWPCRTHAFDMLLPFLPVSRRAIRRFEEAAERILRKG